MAEEESRATTQARIASKVEQRDSQESLLDSFENYLGSTESTDVKRWVPPDGLLPFQTVPALVNMIGEVISNAFDNHIKTQQAGCFKDFNVSVTVYYEQNCVTVSNTGIGIPIAPYNGSIDNDIIALKAFGDVNFGDSHDDNNKKVPVWKAVLRRKSGQLLLRDTVHAHE